MQILDLVDHENDNDVRYWRVTQQSDTSVVVSTDHDQSDGVIESDSSPHF